MFLVVPVVADGLVFISAFCGCSWRVFAGCCLISAFSAWTGSSWVVFSFAKSYFLASCSFLPGKASRWVSTSTFTKCRGACYDGNCDMLWWVGPPAANNWFWPSAWAFRMSSWSVYWAGGWWAPRLGFKRGGGFFCMVWGITGAGSWASCWGICAPGRWWIAVVLCSVSSSNFVFSIFEGTISNCPLLFTFSKSCWPRYLSWWMDLSDVSFMLFNCRWRTMNSVTNPGNCLWAIGWWVELFDKSIMCISFLRFMSRGKRWMNVMICILSTRWRMAPRS